MRPGRMIFWYIHDNRYVCAKPYKQPFGFLGTCFEHALSTTTTTTTTTKKGKKIAEAIRV